MAKRQKIQPSPIAPVSADPAAGLTWEQVRHRSEGGWSNRTSTNGGLSEKEIVLQHIFTYFNLIFVILAAILVVCGCSVKNMTFLIVVVINTVIGIVQQIRAKRAVEKLTLVAAHPVKTVRDGALQEIPSAQLVRDDIVEFSAGSQICADGVLRTGQLQVNESLVTGEADLVTKNPGDSLLSGSFVAAGRGRAQLTAVGDAAFAARLAAEAKANPAAAKSEMMRSLDKLIQIVGFGLIPIGLMLFYQEFAVLKLGLSSSGESTVAALVGMIPEGLYLLTSVALAVSAIKLAKKRVLVQDMNCIETLARVDVLCVDKTGTITEPVMTVEDILPLTENVPLETVLTTLYGSAEPDNDTARALHERFSGEGWPCVRRIPFTSRTKWSGCVTEGHGSYLCGAPEWILGSRYPELAGEITPWLQRGCRVLLLAGYGAEPTPELDPELVTPLALILISNPIRPSANAIFRYFAQQKVEIKVISGDNPAAVSHVAQRAGIENAQNYIDASRLNAPEDFRDAVRKYAVFGRVTPDKKKLLIQALHEEGHTVAMTGDGVNDVLALREADCGIAMASGSEAACHVAKMVLLDSDFSAMPGIVDEGRRVINNIQRSASLFLVKNIFAAGIALFSLVLGWPFPLDPIHFTVISTLTIGTPSFFLALEPNYALVKGRFLPQVMKNALPGGLTNLLVVIPAQLAAGAAGFSESQTATLCTAVLAVVGLLVLLRLCRPMSLFRGALFSAMAAGLVLCFTLLGGFLELSMDNLVALRLLPLAALAIGIYFGLWALVSWLEKLLTKK